ncbi:MAG: hypothetical protein AAGC74_03590 [Verrucomicrobiota bacterium]
MNSKFRNGVILLGVLLPSIVVIGAILLIVSQSQKISKEFVVRERNYQQFQREEQNVKSLRQQIAAYSERKNGWKALLGTSDVGSVTGLLREIAEGRSSQEFRQTDFNFVNRQTGIGAASDHRSMSFNLSIDGTYRVLQESLLTLESRMPHLNLNNMKLSPRNDGSSLQLELSYSIWAN